MAKRNSTQSVVDTPVVDQPVVNQEQSTMQTEQTTINDQQEQTNMTTEQTASNDNDVTIPATDIVEQTNGKPEAHVNGAAAKVQTAVDKKVYVKQLADYKKHRAAVDEAHASVDTQVAPMRGTELYDQMLDLARKLLHISDDPHKDALSRAGLTQEQYDKAVEETRDAKDELTEFIAKLNSREDMLIARDILTKAQAEISAEADRLDIKNRTITINTDGFYLKDGRYTRRGTNADDDGPDASEKYDRKQLRPNYKVGFDKPVVHNGVTVTYESTGEGWTLTGVHKDGKSQTHTGGLSQRQADFKENELSLSKAFNTMIQELSGSANWRLGIPDALGWEVYSDNPSYVPPATPAPQAEQAGK